MTYICCNENKNKNVSNKEPQVHEGVQEKDRVSKGQNEVILAEREKTYAVLDLTCKYNISGEKCWHKAKLLISNDSWYSSPAGGTRQA